MKFKSLFLPVALLGLVACGTPKTSSPSAGTVSSSVSTISNVTVGDSSVAAGVVLPITGTFESTIPTGWAFENGTYAPEYYTEPAALKIRFEGISVVSPVFTSVGTVAVKLKIAAINQNTKTTAASTDVFTAYGYNAAGTQVAVGAITSITVSENNIINLTGTDIVKVRVTMTGYQMSGGFGSNVGLAAVTLS